MNELTKMDFQINASGNGDVFLQNLQIRNFIKINIHFLCVIYVGEL